MKLILITTIIFILSSCSNNLFNYKYRLRYSEKNSFNTTLLNTTTSQNISYNRKRISDEEYTWYLDLQFLTPVDSILNHKIDIKNDSNIIKYKYGINSPWKFNNKSNEYYSGELTGTIKVVKFNNCKIVIKGNLFDSKSKLKLKGELKIKNISIEKALH